MNLFQKPIDSAIQLAKTASKTVIPKKKQSVVSSKQLVVYTSKQQTN